MCVCGSIDTPWLVSCRQHWLRPLREFMGEVDEVMATTSRPFDVIEGESLCHALIRFKSGKIASYQAKPPPHPRPQGSLLMPMPTGAGQL